MKRPALEEKEIFNPEEGHHVLQLEQKEISKVAPE